jgi:hypothetical protein
VSQWSNNKHVYQPTVVSVSWHYENPTKHFGLVQSGHHYHLVDEICSRHDMAEKCLIWH